MTFLYTLISQIGTIDFHSFLVLSRESLFLILSGWICCFPILFLGRILGPEIAEIAEGEPARFQWPILVPAVMPKYNVADARGVFWGVTKVVIFLRH